LVWASSRSVAHVPRFVVHALRFVLHVVSPARACARLLVQVPRFALQLFRLVTHTGNPPGNGCDATDPTIDRRNAIPKPNPLHNLKFLCTVSPLATRIIFRSGAPSPRLMDRRSDWELRSFLPERNTYLKVRRVCAPRRTKTSQMRGDSRSKVKRLARQWSSSAVGAELRADRVRVVNATG